MGNFKKRVKKLVGALTGCEIELLGSKSFLVINRKRRTDAWFSRRAQTRSIIEKYDINAVVDVGANEGQYAKDLRDSYSGDIFSFEPVALSFAKLTEAASSDPHWHVYKMALGSQESTQTINVADDRVFSSLLKTSDYCLRQFGPGTQGRREEVVSVRRLGDVLYEIIPDMENKRILLKMDTQGYDAEVFKGLGNSLEHVVALQSEVSVVPLYEGMPHWNESISLYEKAGFGVVGMFPVIWVYERIIEYDCLLVRVEF